MSPEGRNVEKTTIAVVGAGGWGRNLIRNFAALPSVTLKWICDSSDSAQAWIANNYPRSTATKHLDDVLSDPETAGVVLATPAVTHFELGQKVLRAGKDLFVEKPMALSTKDALALDALARQNDRILMVGHLLLYHPVVGAMKRLIDSKELGRVRYMYSQRLNLGVVRRDENAWWSLAPHDVSVMNYLFGSQPEAVSATGGTFIQRDKNIEDVVFATLYYPDAQVGHIHVSWLDPHKTRCMTVVGETKMAVFDDGSPDQKLSLFDKGIEPPGAVGYAEGIRVRTGDIKIPAIPMKEPLSLECDAFVNAIRSRVAPLANGSSGVDVVSVLEAGAQSLRENGRRIEIDSVNPTKGVRA